MARYVVRRVVFLILVYWVISVISFLVFVSLNRNPVPALRIPTSCERQCVDFFRHALGYDQPIWIQYLRYAKGFVPWPGWFLDAPTYFSRADFITVREQIGPRIPITVTLAVGVVTLTLLIGVSVGVRGALRDTRRRTLGGALGTAALSVPVFFLGALLREVLSVRAHLVPAGGLPWHGQAAMTSSGVVQSGPVTNHTVLWAMLHGYFLMPWLALAVPAVAVTARRVRDQLARQLREDHVRTEEGAGLRKARILRHALRPVLARAVASIGADLWILAGGIIVVETLFNLPGIGNYAMRSFFTNDIPAVVGVTAAISLAVVGASLLSAVVGAGIDPGIRRPAAASRRRGV